MTTQMTLAKITSLAAVLALAAGTARADLLSVSFTTSSPPGAAFQVPDWNIPITVPKFNPALGFLDNITFSLTGFVEGSARLENTSPSSGSDVKLTLASSLKLTRPGDAAPLVVATPIVINNFAASPFDGVVDFAGSSGTTLAAISGSKFNKFDYNSDADKTLFTGLGSITLPLSAVGTSRANGGASTISFFDTRTRGEVTVTYNYHAVPEPRVYGMMGAMLCAGFALLRQLRSKKS